MPQAITNSFAVPDMIVTTPAVAYVSEPALPAPTGSAFVLITHLSDFDRL